MIDACNLAIYFITNIVAVIPQSPFMFVFALAIVTAILNTIFNLYK